MIRVGVAHPGVQHLPQTALAFQEAGALRWFATSYYYEPDAWPERSLRLLPPMMRHRAERQLLRRREPALEDRFVRRAFDSDILERLIGGVAPRLRSRLHYRRNLAFPAQVLRLFEREPVDVLWGTATCLDAFRALKARGVFCVLDQTTGHTASLLRAMEAEDLAHPDFFLKGGVLRGRSGIPRQQEAADLADLVVVGSAFAAETMAENGVDPAKLRIVPYGYDERLFPDDPPARAPLAGRPAEFLYVGWIGAMKGIAYLLEAFRRIDPARARLTLAGPLQMPAETFARYADRVTWLGRLDHRDVPAAMRRADAFTFPSLFEGGGIVLYEAAAAGLGVLQSSACGDGVRAGNGGVFAPASVDAIVDAIETALEGDTLQQWADASWRIRKERTWGEYRSAVAALIADAKLG